MTLLSVIKTLNLLNLFKLTRKSVIFSFMLLFLVSLVFKFHSSLLLHGFKPLLFFLFQVFSSLGFFSELWFLLLRSILNWVHLNWLLEALLDFLLYIRDYWLVKVDLLLMLPLVFFLFFVKDVCEISLEFSLLGVHLQPHEFVH